MGNLEEKSDEQEYESGPTALEGLEWMVPIWGDIKFWKKLKEPGIIMVRGGEVNDQNRSYYFSRFVFVKYLAYAALSSVLFDFPFK